MKFFAAVLLIGFTCMAVFGFLPLLQDSQSSMMHCLASLTTSTPCPELNDGFAFAVHHLQAYGAFSTAILTIGIAFLFIMVFAFIAELLCGRIIFTLLPSIRRYMMSLQHSIVVEAMRSYMRWFALLELSPSLR